MRRRPALWVYPYPKVVSTPHTLKLGPEGCWLYLTPLASASASLAPLLLIPWSTTATVLQKQTDCQSLGGTMWWAGTDATCAPHLWHECHDSLAPGYRKIACLHLLVEWHVLLEVTRTMVWVPFVGPLPWQTGCCCETAAQLIKSEVVFQHCAACKASLGWDAHRNFANIIFKLILHTAYWIWNWLITACLQNISNPAEDTCTIPFQLGEILLV